ncbi:MAG: site-specific DNA-methyltransferase [Gaiellaceae bacterium]
MAEGHSGRLELTWTNKQLRLLSHEDGSYEWLPPADYRVAEARLLRDAGTTGEVHSDRQRAKDNLLIRGDSLNALTSLTRIPEFRDEYVGKVQLVYIDPPFNTQQAFEQYDDALEHSVWLTMMRDRLQLLKKMLADDGSIWVHCDDSEQGYLRVLMDEVFGRQSFVATVVWEKRYSRSNDASLSVSHDYILVYAKDSVHWAKTRNLLARTAEQGKQYSNPDNDPKGPWRAVPFDAPNIRANLSYPITTPAGTVRHPPKGRHWSTTEDKWLKIVESGLAYFGKKGDGAPAVKRYLEDDQGIVPNTWWEHEDTGHTDEANKEIRALIPDVAAFATPKPERLMARIIQIATNPGDIVLDCFAGSGTTAAVAHKMRRRWVTGEWSRETLETFTGPRLEKVVSGDDVGGISGSVEWTGGGGFRVLDVAPSMFEAFEGQVLLAEWAVGSALSEAVAAQFGYEYDSELLPFAGRKGRVRLAVVDGLVNEAVARLLVAELPEDERLCLCGTMVDQDVREVLRELRPGSTVRKVPETILADYRQGQFWWDRHAGAVESNGDEPAEPAAAEQVQA